MLATRMPRHVCRMQATSATTSAVVMRCFGMAPQLARATNQRWCVCRSRHLAL